MTKFIQARARLAPADRSGFAVRALAAEDTTEILLYDEIGMWGINAGDFVRELQMITTGNILVRVNSPGGDVFDGLAIFNALGAHPAKVQTHIDGLAASIASVIALAGDTVTAAENSFFMIHNPWSIVIGNATDMRDMAAILDKVTGQLIALYAEASGQAALDVAAMIGAETWLTAAEAVASGFVDSILDEPLHAGEAATASAKAAEVFAGFDLSIYRNLPRALRQRVASKLGAPDGRQDGPGGPQEGPGGGQVDSSRGQEGTSSARFRRLQQARLSLLEKATR
jgi:ATP-dependent protease ClpP protease subunit